MTRLRVFVAFLSLLITVYSASPSHAQARRGELFDKDYTRDIMQGKGGSPELLPSQQQGNTEQAATPHEQPVPQDTPAVFLPPPEATPTLEATPLVSPETTPTPLPLRRGEKITRIGAIINGMEEEHRNKMVAQLARYSVESSVPLGMIYIVGPMLGKNNVGDSFVLALSGGTLEGVDAPPAPYTEIKRSPTWLIQTERGEIVVEGSPELTKFASPLGEFTGPEK
jgi:hypothetical protein